MALIKRQNKALTLAKMYYSIYKSEPFYMKGRIPYLDDMINQKLAEVRYLPGDILVIKMVGAGKLQA